MSFRPHMSRFPPQGPSRGAVPGAGPAIDVETDALGEATVAGSPMPPALVSFDG